jgi:amidase
MSVVDDAVAQARSVRDGAVSPSELVQVAVDRIEELDGAVNAVVHRRFDAARREAGGTLPAGPFRGVPLLIKDALCHTAGDPYHVGMRLLAERHWVEPDDTELAARFRRAGFVVVGRTNTPELATAYTTEPLLYGPTRNPWDLSRTAGGSSGGSAAAVAAGMVAVAHGNDMGGSIRVPASCCGVVGLKPTRARTSLGPDFGEYWAMLTHEGVLTRTVRDTAAVLDAVAGPAAGDPYTAPPPVRRFSSALEQEPSPLRVGFRTTVPVERTAADLDCVRAVEWTARLLGECGHRVEEAAPDALDDPEVGEHFAAVFTASVARDLDRWGARLGVRIGPEDVEPRNWMLAEHGRAVSGVRLLAAVERLQAYSRRVARWWSDGFDLLVTPTLPVVPPRLGQLAVEPDLAAVADLGQFASPFNVTGQPAVSLPLHATAGGLPVGVQLVAAYGREDLLLAVAAQLERAAPWSTRHPPPRSPT